MERFRGSSEIPLNQEGVNSARDVGMKLAQRGGLDELHTSSLGRAVHTARIISQYTHAPIVSQSEGFHPWHAGPLEGQEVTPERVDFMKDLVKNNPDQPLSGRGPSSTADGESFNDFKDRALDALQPLLRASQARPDARIGVVTHYRVKKLIESWLRKGALPDGTIDPEEMNRHDSGHEPTSVDRLHVDPYAGPQLSAVDLDSPASLQGGVYIIRHGKTEWNSDQS